MGIADWLLANLKQLLHDTAMSASGAFIAYAIPLVGVGIAIYITFLGIQIGRGTVQSPLQDLTLKLFKMALICSLLVGTGAYGTWVVGFLEGLRDGLASAVTGGSTPESVVTAVSNDFGLKAKDFADQASQSWGVHIELWLTVLLFWACRCILIVCVMLPLLISYGNFYLTIAIGPLFIACLLFPPTAKYFDSWLSTALVAAMTNVAVALVMSASTRAFQLLSTKVGTLVASGDAYFLSVAFDALVATVILAYMGWKAGDLAAHWVGGSSMFNPLDRGFFTTPAGAVAGGAASGARGVASWIGKRLNPNQVKPG